MVVLDEAGRRFGRLVGRQRANERRELRRLFRGQAPVGGEEEPEPLGQQPAVRGAAVPRGSAAHPGTPGGSASCARTVSPSRRVSTQLAMDDVAIATPGTMLRSDALAEELRADARPDVVAVQVDQLLHQQPAGIVRALGVVRGAEHQRIEPPEVASGRSSKGTPKISARSHVRSRCTTRANDHLAADRQDSRRHGGERREPVALGREHLGGGGDAARRRRP